MSGTDFRAALERLISAYDEHGGRWPDHHVDALHNAVKRARADLAAEPPDPANGESLLPAMLTAAELASSWNQQADEFNRWDSLDSGEQLAWAQARAIARDRADRLPDPAGGGEALLAAAPLEGEDNAWERAKERAWDMYKTVGYQGEQALDDRGFDRAADLIRDEITLARRVPAPAAEEDVGELVGWLLQRCQLMSEAPGSEFHMFTRAATLLQQLATAAPAAPPKGEVGELVAWLNNHAAHLRTMEGIGALPETELQERLDRAATLLEQQAAELAALRAPQGGEVE